MLSLKQTVVLFGPLATLLSGQAQAQSSGCPSLVSASQITLTHTETETVTLASHARASTVTTTIYLSGISRSGGMWQPTLSSIDSAALSSITAAAQVLGSPSAVDTTGTITMTIHYTETITPSPTPTATGKSFRASLSEGYPMYTWRPSAISSVVTQSVEAEEHSPVFASSRALRSTIPVSAIASTQAANTTSSASANLLYSSFARPSGPAASIYPASAYASSASVTTLKSFSNSSSLSEHGLTSTVEVSSALAAATMTTSQKATSTVELSTASTSATSTSSSCPASEGSSGNFTLDWDDEPSFSTTDPNAGQFPPVFNPYHHLFFSNGYAYVPPPNDPFPPISPPQLAIFLPNASTQNIGSPSAAGARPGEIGAGPRAALSSFWFTAYSLWLGCDDDGPSTCEISISGFVWDDSTNSERLVATQISQLQPCPGFQNCHLQEVNLQDGRFVGLSGLQITANINSTPQIFFIDNLDMGWFNNTCEAVQERSMTRK